ncbi:MAG: hypothetical protein GVX96_02555 [Bacteroidetes bacterium]|jgi:membrane protease YdiL (CAAX protease family)|nr:hypothetical protein [Bacteroidota bacterium]
MIYRNREVGSFSLIIGLLLFAAFMIGIFYLIKGLYAIMLYIAPILAISILFIDYKTYVAYGKWLKRKFQRDILSGISWTLVSIVGFPFVLFILLYRAVFLKGIQSSKNPYQHPFSKKKDYIEYQEYEIVDEDAD